MNNQRQLAVAWHLYHEDNGGKFINNWDGPAGSWVLGNMSINGPGTYGANTNKQNLVDLKWVQNTGPLPRSSNVVFGAYMVSYVGIFKCPSDKSVEFGTQMPRVRSVSMNRVLGANVRAWEPVQGLTNRVFRHFSEVKRPSELFLFVDEHPAGINDGSFTVPVLDLSKPDTWGMIDIPSPHHAAGTVFSFTDGHVEFHKLQDQRPLFPIAYAKPLNGEFRAMPHSPDARWLSQHAHESRWE